jgi:hypothetical protein
MPPRSREPDLVRLVVGGRGEVPMRMQLIVRFDYGAVVPWPGGAPFAELKNAMRGKLVVSTRSQHNAIEHHSVRDGFL